MLRSLGTLVDPTTVVVFVLAGTLSFVAAAAIPSPLATALGLGAGLLSVLGALAMAFLVWVKRVNADIDSDRHDIEREVDDLIEKDDGGER